MRVAYGNLWTVAMRTVIAALVLGIALVSAPGASGLATATPGAGMSVIAGHPGWWILERRAGRWRPWDGPYSDVYLCRELLGAYRGQYPGRVFSCRRF